MSGSTYWPASLVVIVRTTPVSVFVTVTLALPITAPEGSVTVPRIVASWPNANAEPNVRSANTNKHPRRKSDFMVKPPELNVVKLRINVVEERLGAHDVCTRMGTLPATSDAFGGLCDEPYDSGFVLPAPHPQKLASHRVSRDSANFARKKIFR